MNCNKCNKYFSIEEISFCRFCKQNLCQDCTKKRDKDNVEDSDEDNDEDNDEEYFYFCKNDTIKQGFCAECSYNRYLTIRESYNFSYLNGIYPGNYCEKCFCLEKDMPGNRDFIYFPAFIIDDYLYFCHYYDGYICPKCIIWKNNKPLKCLLCQYENDEIEKKHTKSSEL